VNEDLYNTSGSRIIKYAGEITHRLTAVGFITAVYTVSPSVAFSRQWNTCATATTELILTACCTHCRTAGNTAQL